MHLRRGDLRSSRTSQPRPTLARPCSPSRRVLLLCCSPLHPLDPHHCRGRSLQPLCCMVAYFTYSPLVQCCNQRYADNPSNSLYPPLTAAVGTSDGPVYQHVLPADDAVGCG